MTESYSDVVPTEPGAYPVRARHVKIETIAELSGQRWTVYGVPCQYDERTIANSFTFGPRIPTAAELVELREKAAMLAWLDSKKYDVEFANFASGHKCCLWDVANDTALVAGGADLISAIRAAMAAEKGGG